MTGVQTCALPISEQRVYFTALQLQIDVVVCDDSGKAFCYSAHFDDIRGSGVLILVFHFGCLRHNLFFTHIRLHRPLSVRANMHVKISGRQKEISSAAHALCLHIRRDVCRFAASVVMRLRQDYFSKSITTLLRFALSQSPFSLALPGVFESDRKSVV